MADPEVIVHIMAEAVITVVAQALLQVDREITVQVMQAVDQHQVVETRMETKLIHPVQVQLQTLIPR